MGSSISELPRASGAIPTANAGAGGSAIGECGGPGCLELALDGALARFGREPTALIQVLRAVQDECRRIDGEAIAAVSAAMHLPQAHIEAVVSFYRFFHARRRGCYEVLFSDNITDRMRGSRALAARLCERLGLEPGDTRADGLVSVDYTSCTGINDQCPGALVNGQAITRLDPVRIDQIAGLIEGRVPMERWPRALFAVSADIHRGDGLFDGLGGIEPGSAVRAALDTGPERMLELLAAAGLRGVGGAGFPTAAKWRLCRDAEADARYVICNADEGEPGTFKDRVLLQRFPDWVVEGMTLCAAVVGARRGYIYLRAEYAFLIEPLEALLAQRREMNLLGPSILGRPGFDFDLEIHLGAGAYICGEESALIESLEGKRGIPRRRPPFPVTRGFLNKPSVVNNVETLAVAAKIAVHGAQWHADLGTERSRGTKLLSVSGDCDHPGVYEYPFGVSIAQVLADCGARNPIAVQVAGPAGHLVPRAQFGRRIAFEDLATGGSFMVFDDSRDILDIVENFAEFFKDESCGFCTPCRVGTRLIVDLLEKLRAGRGTGEDLGELEAIGRTMAQASHCGLGHTAPHSLLDSLREFPEVYAEHLSTEALAPTFDLDAELAEARGLRGEP